MAAPLTARFTGTIAWLAPMEVADLVDWLAGIPFEAWPQQHPWEDGSLRPAMVNDLDWQGFGKRTEMLTAEILEHFPGCRAGQRMLSVIMPGHAIPEHADAQAPDWICRVHVPLTTNVHTGVGMPDGLWWLQQSQAYRFNTEAPHTVWNHGATPRTHFLLDVHAHA